jgi:hypothetical protein
MAEGARPRITIAVYAPPTAFAAGAQSTLVRLGYNLLTPGTAGRQRGSQALLPPALQIVDERLLDQLPLEDETPLPILLLIGPEGPPTSDARCVGSVRRRARAEELYAVLQRALEARPRGVLRIEDTIPAHCTRDGREWTGLIRSLSEKGCLLESANIEKDLRVDLRFPLANRGTVRVPAQTAYVQGKRAGLVFRGGSELSRVAIADYVSSRLGG